MRPRSACRRRAAAFTLVEMMVSVVIASMILGAITSAMLLASQAVPQRSGGLDRAVQASSALDRILTDLYYAKSIPQRAADSITLTVADRNGDGADETIRYTWTGTAGAPLTRQVNASAAAALLDDVREFALAYDLGSVNRQVTTTTESAESLLWSYNAGSLGYDFAINANNWLAQYFKPTLPAGTVSWRVTRVSYRSRYHGLATGLTQVQVRPVAASGAPANYVLDQASVAESGLGAAWGWVPASFSAAGPLDPTKGAYVVWQWGSGTDSADILYDLLGAPISQSYLANTGNSGNSWSANSWYAAGLYVYGTTATATTTTTTDYYLQGVQVTLRSSTDTTARVRGATALLNAPQVTGP